MVIFPNVFTFLLREELRLSPGDETLQLRFSPAPAAEPGASPFPLPLSRPALLLALGLLVCRFKLKSKPPFSQAIYSLKTAN